MSDNASRVLQAQRLLETGRPEEARDLLARVIDRDPAHAGALGVLARVHFQLGNPFVALQVAHKAVASAPDSAEAIANLGLLLGLARQREQAIESYERCVQLDPSNAVYPEQLAVQLVMALRPLEAVSCCDRALLRFPDHPRLMRILAAAHLAAGHAEQALDILRKAARDNPTDVAIAEAYAFTTNYASGVEATESLEAHTRHAQLVRASLKPLVLPRVKPDLDPERPLRIGLVSPDFWGHAVASFIAPLLEQIDRDRCEITCYSTGVSADSTTARLASLAARFEHVAAYGPRDLARLIASNKTDILIDLSGLTANHRLPVFLYKPAPVQVTYLGYPNTTGAAALDFRIVDAHTDPAPHADAHVVERLIRLDPCFLCYNVPPDAPDPGPPPVAESDNITFGSFNDLKKLNDATIKLWSEVLTAVPGSRLMLKSFGLTHERTRADLVTRFARHAIDPGRLNPVPPASESRDHLSLYRNIDIALDPFPYHGTTTTCEALAMGVPVATLAGDRHASRVGVSLLSNVGLPECIATSASQYVSIAAALASDQKALASLRAGLRDRLRASPLANAASFANRFSDALRETWRSHIASLTSKGARR